MHEHLAEVIESAREARRAIVAKEIDVKTANAISNQNHAVLMAHALDLRERMFLADVGTPGRLMAGAMSEPAIARA